MDDKKLRVLLVEDSESDAKQIARLLKAARDNSFRLTTVNHLQSAREKLRTHLFDIILLDLELPDSKGIATFDILNSECRRIPIIIFTILGEESVGLEAISHGAQDYLAKGTTDEKIISKSIRYAIERKRLQIEQMQTHEALKESEERFRNIFNNAAMGMVEYDTAHHFISVNDHVCRILGYSREELLGKRVLDITAPEDKELTEKTNNLIHTGEANRFIYEKRYLRRDGSRMWAHVTLSAIHNDEGKHILTVGTIEDITERKKTEQLLRDSEERYRTLFDSIDEGYCIIEMRIEPGQPLDYRFIEINQAFERQSTLVNAKGKWMRELRPEHEEHWFEMYRDVALTGKPVRFEQSGRALHSRWFSVYAFRFGNPEQRRVAVLFNDITERKIAEQNLQQALLKAEEGSNILAALMEYIPLGITIADAPDVNIRMVSKFGQQILEKSNEEIAGIPAPEHPSKWGIWHADGITPGTPDELPLSRATMKGEVIKNEEWIVTRKDGTLVPILCNAAPILDMEGKVTGGVIGWQDITEQRQSRKALQESEERFRTVFDSNMLAIAFWRTDGSLTDANQAFCNLIGCTMEEVRSGGIKWVDFTPADILWRDQQGIEEINATGVCQPYEKKFIHRDGHIVPILIGGASIRAVKDQGVAFAIDLSAQKEIEKAIRESEERFRIMADGVPMIIWVTDKKGAIQFVNRTYVDFFGASFKQVEGGKWQPLVHPDDADYYVGEYLRSVSEHIPFRAEARVRRADGQWRWVMSYGEPRYSTNGEFLGHIGLSPDITDRKQAEDQVRARTTELEAILSCIADGVLVYDKQGRIVRSNSAADNILKYQKSETELPLAERVSNNYSIWTEDGQQLKTTDMPALRASVNAETTRNKVFLVRGRGEPQWISISAAPLFVSGIHTGGVVSISDITDRKQAEEALKKSENDLKILNENLESIVIQRTEQVRALSTALTFAEQRERKRFSYVLHEALQQKLFGAKMVLSQFVREHEKTGEFIGIDELNDGVRIIDKALQLTKTLSLELNPPILQTQGLDTALEWLGQHMRMNYGLNVAIEINGPINQVRGDIQMLLTQMVRELLNNVVKHSGVLKAVVRATCESNVIKITIKDEGRGFDMKTMEGKVTDETKFGLFSVSQRLKLLGGELIIDSKIGHGTQSTITCPVCNL